MVSCIQITDIKRRSTPGKQIFNNDVIKQTEAYKNGKIVYLNSEIWYVASRGANRNKDKDRGCTI